MDFLKNHKNHEISVIFNCLTSRLDVFSDETKVEANKALKRSNDITIYAKFYVILSYF